MGAIASNGRPGSRDGHCCDEKAAQNIVCIGGTCPASIYGKPDDDGGLEAGTVVSLPVQTGLSDAVDEQLAGYSGPLALDGTAAPIEAHGSNGSEPYSGQSGGLTSNQSGSARTLAAATKAPQRVLAPRGNSEASAQAYESSGSSKHGDPITPVTPHTPPETPISIIRENGNTGLPTRISRRVPSSLSGYESPAERARRHSSGGTSGGFLRAPTSEWDSDNVVTPQSIDDVNDFFINQPEFEVDLVDERLPLGAKVFNAENKILIVVSVANEGALARWNAANPENRIQKGDIITEISGIGRGPVSAFEMFFSKELEQMVAASSMETFSRLLRLRHDAFEVSLAGIFGEEQVLGLELAPVPSANELLVAKSIGDGLVQTWNEEAGPYNICINVGDIILEANGVSGNAQDMLRAIKQSKNSWRLKVVHVQTPTAPAVAIVNAASSVFGSHGSHPSLI
mmetsp:Transcript_46833/g.85784  ORF Transcript_46833/g.85784 Transcript_46833/m.85784 type:complete len:455 (-) Transcript_46833:151-1515(-)